MTICEGCGAAIDADDKECPYCGHSILQRVEAQKSALENQEGVYSIEKDEEGNSRIHFGDGQIGSRPSSSGADTSGQYRRGAGSQGNVHSRRLEEKLNRVDRHLENVTDLSKQDESKDLGVALIESMSAIGDLLSFYQDIIFQEASLDSSDRKRLSRKEREMKPKLKSIVTFCDRIDSKTQKKMGLSDSDIRRIKMTATQALQRTESGKCSGCGAVNRLGSTQCQNCGARL